MHGMKRLYEMLDAHRTAGERLFITLLISDNTVMAFHNENWSEFEGAVARFIEGEAQGKPSPFVVIVRRFETDPPPVHGIPMKSVAAYTVDRNRIAALPPAQVQQSFEVDSMTGKPLTPELQLRYVEGDEMLPELAVADENKGPASGRSLH